MILNVLASGGRALRKRFVGIIKNLYVRNYYNYIYGENSLISYIDFGYATKMILLD